MSLGSADCTPRPSTAYASEPKMASFTASTLAACSNCLVPCNVSSGRRRPRGSCPPPGHALGHGAVRPLQHSPRHLTGERARAADGGDAPQRAGTGVAHDTPAAYAAFLATRAVMTNADADAAAMDAAGANCARCFTVSPTSDAALEEDLRTRERERAGRHSETGGR